MDCKVTPAPSHPPTMTTSSSSLPRLSRRQLLAPTQPKHALPQHDEVDASLLMDMSLAELKKSSPVKKQRAAGRAVLVEADLDHLSQDELEALAWEAVEEERKLQKRSSSNRLRRATTAQKVEESQRAPTAATDVEPVERRAEDPMRNITIRRHSNSPRKVLDRNMCKEELSPLPRSSSTAMPIKHSYDRQASPTRSALRRPQTRKSVAFGEVAEYDISSGDVGEGVSPSDQSEGPRVLASHDAESSKLSSSSSPLSRFSKAMPAVKTLYSATPAIAKPERASPAVKKLAKATQPPLVASSRRSSLRSGKQNGNAPIGFRLTTAGTLVAETRCKPFKATSAPIASRKRRSSTGEKVTSSASKAAAIASKANPVPQWLKRRKEALLMAEEDQLRKQLELVRTQELGKTGSNDKVRNSQARPERRAAQANYTSAVEKRITARAAWENKRREREALLDEERQRAIKEREKREEDEYRLARQRSVIRANPVPDWLRARAAK